MTHVNGFILIWENIIYTELVIEAIFRALPT